MALRIGYPITMRGYAVDNHNVAAGQVIPRHDDIPMVGALEEGRVTRTANTRHGRAGYPLTAPRQVWVVGSRNGNDGGDSTPENVLVQNVVDQCFDLAGSFPQIEFFCETYHAIFDRWLDNYVTMINEGSGEHGMVLVYRVILLCTSYHESTPNVPTSEYVTDYNAFAERREQMDYAKFNARIIKVDASASFPVANAASEAAVSHAIAGYGGAFPLDTLGVTRETSITASQIEEFFEL